METDATLNATQDETRAEELVLEMERVGEKIRAARISVSNVIFGQEDVVDDSLVTLLSGGHALLVGVPGLAKTRLVETLGRILGLSEQRVQFTPDLMPADILGSEVLEESDTGRRSFRFMKGPVFSQLLMADEINRASPRTQSALLQAMQEGRVSVAGQYHTLPSPFHVLATQNPLEHEGTYPLPEAQLDRFLMQIDVDYPDLDAERHMMITTTSSQAKAPSPVMTSADLQSAQALVRRIPVGESVVNAILSIVRAGRPETSHIAEVVEHVGWGPGPRASQALMLTCRAKALINGQLAPSIDDVLALAKPVLKHRMALKFTARHAGINIEAIIELLCRQIR